MAGLPTSSSIRELTEERSESGHPHPAVGSPRCRQELWFWKRRGKHREGQSLAENIGRSGLKWASHMWRKWSMLRVYWSPWNCNFEIVVALLLGYISITFQATFSYICIIFLDNLYEMIISYHLWSTYQESTPKCTFSFNYDDKFIRWLFPL